MPSGEAGGESAVGCESAAGGKSEGDGDGVEDNGTCGGEACRVGVTLDCDSADEVLVVIA